MSAPAYLVALGSNRRHPELGEPRRVLRAGFDALDGRFDLIAVSKVLSSAPLGPSRRRYANAAALVGSDLAPRAMLAELHAIETHFGRIRRGQRWGARVLDLDIVLWSGGAWGEPDLTIPHREFRHRGFVLQPAAAIAPGWRDPLTGLTLRQLAARLDRPAGAA